MKYHRFVSLQTDEKVKSVPQPSETRWLFYRDVLRSILSQTRLVDIFVRREEEFDVFWSRMKEKPDEYGQCVENEFSLESCLINAHFRFVAETLEVLGRVNVLLQERYIVIHDAWSIIISLKKNILRLKTSLISLFGGVPVLTSLERN